MALFLALAKAEISAELARSRTRTDSRAAHLSGDRARRSTAVNRAVELKCLQQDGEVEPRGSARAEQIVLISGTVPNAGPTRRGFSRPITVSTSAAGHIFSSSFCRFSMEQSRSRFHWM